MNELMLVVHCAKEVVDHTVGAECITSAIKDLGKEQAAAREQDSNMPYPCAVKASPL
jgi:hypothetical protein